MLGLDLQLGLGLGPGLGVYLYEKLISNIQKSFTKPNLASPSQVPQTFVLHFGHTSIYNAVMHSVT